MNMYKSIAIKVVIVASIAFFLSTEFGKPYANQLRPLIEMVIQQSF